MIKMLIVLGLTSSCFASAWNPVTNFNSPNNPGASSVFSYGVGGTPGSFATLGTSTLNCVGASTYCYNNGGGFPNYSGVVWNGSGSDIVNVTLTYSATMIDMDPENTAGTIIRFTAPWTDNYSVDGLFQANDGFHHTTTGEIWVNNTNPFGASIGSFPSPQSFSLSGLSLNAGDTIDFIVKSASDCCYLTTGLQATITSDTSPGVPEPGTLLLMGSAALAGILGRRRLGLQRS